MSSQYASRMLLGTILATACAQDTVMPGYDDPSLGQVDKSGSGGAASGGGGSDMPPDTMETAGGMASMTPSMPTTTATAMPTTSPTSLPTGMPTTMPTGMPTAMPTGMPTGMPTTTAPPADPKCDLSGRWLVVQRSVEEGLGVQTALRNWMYFEFAQNGQNVTTVRGLDCGFDVVPLSAISGAADLHKSWPKIMENNPMAGRKATIQATSSGCTVSFPSFISVYGVTPAAYYKDPSHSLPSPTDQAAGTTPGWQDWDADGNPGISYNISGIATGQVFYSARQTNTWSGAIGQTGNSFTLSLLPKHENDQLGYSGSPLLTTQSQLAADKTLHFVDFARLDAMQATGDDTATCSAVRNLATTLAPKANAKPF